MRDYTEQAQLFKTLAHPVRLQILEILRHGEACVCHMEALLGRRQPYISQQLMALRDARLVDSHKDGLNVFYTLSAPAAITPLLDVVLGLSDDSEPQQPEHCTCPRCAALSIPQYQRTQ